MVSSVSRRRIVIGLVALACFALLAAGSVFWRYRDMTAAILADGATLHRILSQRVDQHDAHLTSLAALAQAADPPPLDAIRQVASSITRFYPRIQAIELADLADEARPPLLSAGVPLEEAFAAAHQSTATLTVVPVAGAEQVMLIKRVPATGPSRYLVIMLINLRKLVEIDRFGPKPGMVQLLLDGKPLLAVGETGDEAPVVFEAPLASRTQPLVLCVASPLSLSAAVPSVTLALIALGVLLAALILDRLLAARAAAREAGARAALATQDARLAHASRVNAMGELASGIAHELTQPLTAILSQSQAGQRLAARPDLDRASIQTAFEASARNAKRAGDILGKLRSWITKGQPLVEPVDLVQVIGDVVQLTAEEATAHAVTLSFERPAHPAIVRADRVQMEQVVFNLVHNAIEATKALPHPPRIVIMLSTADTTAELRVRDNGPGFEAASLTRIFEPFFTTKRDGMGLGLSLCVTLVERYGGTIAARNLEGGGAELTVRLPLMESALGTLLGEAAE